MRLATVIVTAVLGLLSTSAATSQELPQAYITNLVSVQAYGLDHDTAYECIYEFYPDPDYGSGTRISAYTVVPTHKGYAACAADPHFLSRGEEGVIEAKLAVNTGASDYDEEPIQTATGEAEAYFQVP